MDEKETANYKITGLVDIFDEQGQIRGQYPVGSVQELTVERGNAAIEAGQAELTDESPVSAEDTGGTEAEAEAEVEVEETEESDEDADDEVTGETGEGEVE